MQLLLVTHILAGGIAVLGAALAILSDKGKRLHVLSCLLYTSDAADE